MLKFVESAVVTAEIPDEITLAINISGCPIRCPQCHSKYLWNDIGEPLTQEVIYDLLDKNQGVTCVAFMGGDLAPDELNPLAFAVKCREDYPYRTAWYSGQEDLSLFIDLTVFDYIKLGPYKKEFGPLNKRTTNQRFYEVQISHMVNNDYSPIYGLVDITEKFWK